MRVLVTGATGFLGGTLIHHLRDRGFETVVLGRDEARCERLRKAGFLTFRTDLSRPDPDLAGRVGALDAIVHCAALSSPWGSLSAFHAANVEGTRNALDLAAACGVRRFVNISSPTVYFEMKDRIGIAETAPLPTPVNAYAATKAEAEHLVLSRRELGPVNLRPRGIYGAGEETLLPRLRAAAERGPLPLLRGGIAAIDLTHISDVVSAIDAALAPDPALCGETFNISGGEVLAVREIVERTCAALAVSVRWRRMPFHPVLAATKLACLASRVTGKEPTVTPYTLGLFAFSQSLDIGKARRMLNWRPIIPFVQGLAMTLEGGMAR